MLNDIIIIKSIMNYNLILLGSLPKYRLYKWSDIVISCLIYWLNSWISSSNRCWLVDSCKNLFQFRIGLVEILLKPQILYLNL